eukprot:symbB.v1.2.018150.t1/scaffold1415.1/size121899/3
MAFNQCQECQSFVIVAVDSRTSFVATLSSCNSLSAIFVAAAASSVAKAPSLAAVAVRHFIPSEDAPPLGE